MTISMNDNINKNMSIMQCRVLIIIRLIVIELNVVMPIVVAPLHQAVDEPEKIAEDFCSWKGFSAKSNILGYSKKQANRVCSMVLECPARLGVENI
jgi:hypothetical protein